MTGEKPLSSVFFYIFATDKLKNILIVMDEFTPVRMDEYVEEDCCCNEMDESVARGGGLSLFSRSKPNFIEKEDNKNKDPYTLWTKDRNDRICSCAGTFDSLEPGYYKIGNSPDIGVHLKGVKVEMNRLYRLPNSASDLLLNDISKFWTLEETYKTYHRVFARNYLLYSAPGTGKTSLINLMCQELIEKYDGIVIYLNSASEIYDYNPAIRMIRDVEPNRRIITIIEDIDAYIGKDGSDKLDGYLLNILDGNMKFGGIVTIATTNYIEKVSERFTNRPSRFDRVVEFPLPNDESRRMFIEKSVQPEDLEKIDVDKWVEKTDGFSIDHINELILLFFVFGHTEEESFETLTRMLKENDSLKNVTSVKKKSKIGFNN